MTSHPVRNTARWKNTFMCILIALELRVFIKIPTWSVATTLWLLLVWIGQACCENFIYCFGDTQKICFSSSYNMISDNEMSTFVKVCCTYRYYTMLSLPPISKIMTLNFFSKSKYKVYTNLAYIFHLKLHKNSCDFRIMILSFVAYFLWYKM